MGVVLMRHADAAALPGTPDHERPLTARGERDARAMGQWLRDNVPDISVVMCSTAARARRTCELVAAELAQPGQPTYTQDIYRAEADELLDLARNHADGVLLVIGHNPAIAGAATALAGEPLPGFPAGAAAVFEMGLGSARLAAFQAP
jgi:phosphohistidine phosphatase